MAAKLARHRIEITHREPPKCGVCENAVRTCLVSYRDIDNPLPDMYAGPSGSMRFNDQLGCCDACLPSAVAIVLKRNKLMPEPVVEQGAGNESPS